MEGCLKSLMIEIIVIKCQYFLPNFKVSVFFIKCYGACPQNDHALNCYVCARAVVSSLSDRLY